jgi:hypothetical protein
VKVFSAQHDNLRLTCGYRGRLQVGDLKILLQLEKRLGNGDAIVLEKKWCHRSTWNGLAHDGAAHAAESATRYSFLAVIPIRKPADISPPAVGEEKYRTERIVSYNFAALFRCAVLHFAQRAF